MDRTTRSHVRPSALLLAAALILAMAAPTLAAPTLAAPTDPRAVVDTRHAQFRQVIADTPDAEPMRDKLQKSMDEFVHYEMFSKLAAKTFWDEMKPEQQKEYVALFTKLIQRTYLKRFKAGKPFDVKLLGETEFSDKKDKALVKSEITSGKISAFVDYKLFQPDGAESGWWVYDVVIDDVSVMRNYRTSFTKTWKTGGFELLVSKMKKKLDKVDKTSDGEDEKDEEKIGDLD